MYERCEREREARLEQGEYKYLQFAVRNDGHLTEWPDS